VEDLTIEEVKQLVNFYKQKSSDLEFQVLQLQIKLNKLISLYAPTNQTTKTVVDKKEKS
jgi:hypothetical protein